MLSERRRKRSSFTGLALHYWLAAVAQRERLLALVLADSAGLLVASSVRNPEAEELAAVAPLLVRGGAAATTALEGGDPPLHIWRLEHDGATLYLCAVGDRDQSKEGIRMALGGVRRILFAH